MQTIFYPGSERGTKDIGWLRSQFSFSFSSYMQPQRNSFGLLQTFNDDVVQPGGGFGLHPHKNMEIISIMLQGKMNHKDSLGYSEVVEAGWVQIMSAGTGLRHEEWNVGEEEVKFLQIWIAPKLQNIDPRYQRRYFGPESRQNTLAKIVSSEEGTAHCWINQNARIFWGEFSQDGSHTLPLAAANGCLFVFVLKGQAKLGGHTLGQRDAVGVWDAHEAEITYAAGTEMVVIEVPVNA